MRAADGAMPRSRRAPRWPVTPSRLAPDLVDPCGDPRVRFARDANAHRASRRFDASRMCMLAMLRRRGPPGWLDCRAPTHHDARSSGPHAIPVPPLSHRLRRSVLALACLGLLGVHGASGAADALPMTASPAASDAPRPPARQPNLCSSWPTTSAIPTSAPTKERSRRRTSTPGRGRPHPDQPPHRPGLRHHPRDADLRHRPPPGRRGHHGRFRRRAARPAGLRGLPERPRALGGAVAEGRRLPHLHRRQVAPRPNLADPAVPLGSAGHTPDQWGFERSFALLGGAAGNHFGHERAGSRNYVEDGRYVQPGQPGQPGGPAARPRSSTRPTSSPTS